MAPPIAASDVMAISRWTGMRLQIVAVVAAIASLCGVMIGWLLSHIKGFVYDFAEIENSARSGLTVGALLAAILACEQQPVHTFESGV